MEQEYTTSILESMLDAVIVANPDGTIRTVNRAALELLGYAEEEIIGQPVGTIFEEEEEEEEEEEAFFRGSGLAQLVREGAARDVELTLLARSGERIPVVFNGSVMREEDGRLAAVVGVARDMREMKRLIGELRASEERYRVLVENASEAIIVGQDEMLKFVNPKCAEISGYSKEELTSKPFAELIHPDDRKMVVERHQKRLKGEEVPPVYPLRIVDKEGNTKWVEINAILITWEGRPATLTFLSDITERVRAEEALRETSARLSTLIEAIPDVVYFKDAQGRTLVVNKACEELVGLPREKIIGKTDEQFLPLDLAEQCRRSDQEVIKRCKPIRIEEQTTDDTGKKIFFETIKSPVLDDQGNIRGLVGVSRDITERKRMEEELRKAKEELEERVEKLETFYRITMGREKRIMELKEEIRELKKKLGERGGAQ